MRRLLRVCTAVMAISGVPAAGLAQTALADDDRAGLISAGAMVGAQLDMPDDWLLFGADARIQVDHALELEPRFTYEPLGDAHLVQLDLNLLKNFDLARPGRFRPFFGIGGALQSYSPDQGDGETKVGLNLISGTRIAMTSTSGYEPFITGQYTIVRDQLNNFTIVVGASFRLRR
jgi:hypothetical protein